MTLTYSGDPGKTLEQVYRADKLEYDQIYRPINREMINSTHSTAMVDAAKATVNSNFDASQARNSRMAERLGINMNLLEQNETGRRASAIKGLNYDHTLNTARVDQYERNNQVRDDMIAIGRGIDRQAYKMLGDAATLQSQRNAANASAQAQSDAQAQALNGSLASAGMMAAYTMGGPAGWALGGISLAFGLF